MITTTAPWRYGSVAARWLLAVIFIVAGGSKAAQPWVFVHTVEGYDMLPSALSTPFGLALPWIEIMLGVYLLIGLFTRVAGAATLALCAVFLVALTVQLVRGHTGDCGCVVGIDNPIVTAFVGGNSIGAWDIVRDALLAALALLALFTPRPPLAVDALLATRREDADRYDLEPDVVEA
jgi:Methylamine utilisation protein MauE